MRILIASDKFKGSLSAGEVAENIALGIRDVISGAEIEIIPVADGGVLDVRHDGRRLRQGGGLPLRRLQLVAGVRGAVRGVGLQLDRTMDHAPRHTGEQERERRGGELAVADDEVGRRHSRPTFEPVAASRHRMQPGDERQAGRANGDAEERERPCRVADDRAKVPSGEQGA